MAPHALVWPKAQEVLMGEDMDLFPSNMECASALRSLKKSKNDTEEDFITKACQTLQEQGFTFYSKTPRTRHLDPEDAEWWEEDDPNEIWRFVASIYYEAQDSDVSQSNRSDSTNSAPLKRKSAGRKRKDPSDNDDNESRNSADGAVRKSSRISVLNRSSYKITKAKVKGHQMGPSDYLCAPGKSAQQFPGNIAFREHFLQEPWRSRILASSKPRTFVRDALEDVKKMQFKFYNKLSSTKIGYVNGLWVNGLWEIIVDKNDIKAELARFHREERESIVNDDSKEQVPTQEARTKDAISTSINKSNSQQSVAEESFDDQSSHSNGDSDQDSEDDDDDNDAEDVEVAPQSPDTRFVQVNTNRIKVDPEVWKLKKPSPLPPLQMPLPVAEIIEIRSRNAEGEKPMLVGTDVVIV